jgi:hypothetical protein
MCNSQYARSYRNPYQSQNIYTPTALDQNTSADPLADVNPNNPTCYYEQDPNQYISTSPSGAPISVTPGPSMPISVQPGGPGTPFISSTQATAPSATQSVPFNFPAPGQMTEPGGAMQFPPMTSQLNVNLPESLTNPAYIPGYLRQIIGSLVRVEFLLTDSMTDRVGILREVGASYIILDSLDGNSQLLCDLFSIRFVTILQRLTPGNYQAARTISAANRFQGV